ncbi:MAG: flagellar basal body P-ring protein FlgI [Vampirovibrionales bacterium]
MPWPRVRFPPGTSASAAGSSTRTAIVTSGRIPNGAIIEREIHTEVGDDSGIEVVLNQSDYEAGQQRGGHHQQYHKAPAYAMDGGTIRVEFPEEYRVNRIPFIAKMNNLEVNRQAHVSKVVINERTGTVVIGNGVKLQPAAVAHGGITVSIRANNRCRSQAIFPAAAIRWGCPMPKSRSTSNRVRWLSLMPMPACRIW